MKWIVLFFLILVQTSVFSQENGFWDVNAIKSQTINLNHGQSKGITVELPRGTSKFSYKIKVISQYATATYDFADMFKNSIAPGFPMLSQAAKVVVSATDPKISYSIENYSGNQKNYCYSSNGIITGTVINYFDYTNRNCLNIEENANVLNFYFKSNNQFFPLKVVFEYIPYIDSELKRGWTKKLKNNLYDFLFIKLKEISNNINEDELKKGLSCILTNVVIDYTLDQFQFLAEYEKQNYFSKVIEKCNSK
jgi:hypothetical protein